MTHPLHEYLTDRFTLGDPGLTGCARRSAWTEDAELSWSIIRSNAILSVIGDLWRVQTPLGEIEFYLTKATGSLLQMRGGSLQSYWTDDFLDLWALARHYITLPDGDPSLPSRTITTLHENQGRLSIQELEVPDHFDYITRVEELLDAAQADPPGRISKATERAVRTCRYCPVKQRCDALDKLRGEDNDWSPNYPVP